MAAMQGTGDYATALEMNADNAWAGDVGSRSAGTQVMTPSALGTYQRPLQVFKYMHIAEFMGGKAARQAQPGTLGSGGAVRVPDSKRNLHLKNTEEGPQGSDEEEGKGKRVGSHDSPKRISQRHKGSKGSTRHGRKSSETAGGAADASHESHVNDGGSSLLMMDQDFFNKGLMVFDAVRMQWRGTAEDVQRARESRKNVEYLDADTIEQELDEDAPVFSKPLSLANLVEVLDEMWEGERML